MTRSAVAWDRLIPVLSNPGFPRNSSLASLPLFFTVCSIFYFPPTHPQTCAIRGGVAWSVRAPCILLGIVYCPEPERHRIGFFVVVVDAGQLFSCWLTVGCLFASSHPLIWVLINDRGGHRLHLF